MEQGFFSQLLEQWLGSLGITESWTGIISSLILLTAFLFLGLVISWIMNRIVFRFLKAMIKKTTFQWDNVLFNDRFFRRLSPMIPLMIMYFILGNVFASDWPLLDVVRRLLLVSVIVVTLRLITLLLDNLHDLYAKSALARKTPIKGYIQLVQIFLYIIGVILIGSTLLNQDPWGLLSGIGALTAVIMLVFKDSIMGLVASVQLNANNMVNIGDWIEVPAYGADGDVIEISLTTVKIRNWDRTISNIPTYALVSGTFRNWRGMVESNGRRIKRSILIDVNSIHFLSHGERDELMTIKLLEPYLRERSEEIRNYNLSHEVKEEDLDNGRHLTNLGTFRAYVRLYLENHPELNPDLTHLVRQLAPGPEGIPLEIYFFTKTTAWVHYESIQADIFDHLYALMPRFGLRPFQAPSGWDWRTKAD